jgi:uncharacterized membrane protein
LVVGEERTPFVPSPLILSTFDTFFLTADLQIFNLQICGYFFDFYFFVFFNRKERKAN